MSPRAPRGSEEDVMFQIVQFVSLKHPNAVVHVDFGSGTFLRPTAAGKQKAMNPRRGHPDIVFYEPRGSFIGLALEVKREGENVRKRDGITPVSEHVGEQLEYLRLLAARGWYAVIVAGAPDCLQLIDDYLCGRLEPESQDGPSLP